jgi:hypothetical protein
MDKLRARIPGSYFLVSGLGMLLGFRFMLLIKGSPISVSGQWQK